MPLRQLLEQAEPTPQQPELHRQRLQDPERRQLQELHSLVDSRYCPGTSQARSLTLKLDSNRVVRRRLESQSVRGVGVWV